LLISKVLFGFRLLRSCLLLLFLQQFEFGLESGKENFFKVLSIVWRVAVVRHSAILFNILRFVASCVLKLSNS